jgi:Ca2+-binding EF-hand superfamily protein
MGGNVSKDTKVTKDQALSAVADAFDGTPRAGMVSIEDIVRAGRVAAEKQPTRLDHWKTTSVDMHSWSLKPSHLHAQFNSPRMKTQSPLASGGRIMAGSNLSVTTLSPSISWKRALDAGGMTRDQRMGKLRVLFDALDVDGSQTVTEDELVAAVAEEGILEKEARALFREMDDSHTGRLTVAKFDHYVAVHTLAIVRDSFKSLDASKDRQILRKEFAMYFMGNGLSKHQVSSLWDKMDQNRNGKISFTEYRDWARDMLETTSLDQVALSLGLSRNV